MPSKFGGTVTINLEFYTQPNYKCNQTESTKRHFKSGKSRFQTCKVSRNSPSICTFLGNYWRMHSCKVRDKKETRSPGTREPRKRGKGQFPEYSCTAVLGITSPGRMSLIKKKKMVCHIVFNKV